MIKIHKLWFKKVFLVTYLLNDYNNHDICEMMFYTVSNKIIRNNDIMSDQFRIRQTAIRICIQEYPYLYLYMKLYVFKFGTWFVLLIFVRILCDYIPSTRDPFLAREGPETGVFLVLAHVRNDFLTRFLQYFGSKFKSTKVYFFVKTKFGNSENEKWIQLRPPCRRNRGHEIEPRDLDSRISTPQVTSWPTVNQERQRKSASGASEWACNWARRKSEWRAILAL